MIVVVGTRWTDVDLMGRLLQEMDDGGDEWVHLHYPAIDEHGEACASSRIPLDQLEETRRTVPSRVWEALWQGNPVPAEGALFPADKLIEYGPDDLTITDPNTGRKIHRPLRYYGASDYAVSDGGGDYTVHIVVGVDHRDNIFVMDLWRGQTGPAESIDAMIALMQKWKPMVWAQEKGVIDRSLGPFMARRMNETKTYIHMAKFASVSDKVTRAQSILGRVSMSKVMFPRHEEWWPAFQSEIIRFPHGRADDQVDAFSLIGRMLAGMHGGRMPPGEPPPGRILSVGGMPVAGYNLMTYNDLLAEEDALRPRRRSGGRRR